MTKPISEKQLVANRENAKKWWVKTKEGKEISKMNALSHWIYSPLLVSDAEKDDFDLILKNLREEYDCHWTSEESLISQIALYEIKLQRISSMEEYFYSLCSIDNALTLRAQFGNYTEEHFKISPYLKATHDFFLSAINTPKFKDIDSFERLQGYREMIENRKAKCLYELMRVQLFKKNVLP